MINVRSAMVDDVEGIVRVLARSFQEDPGTAIFEPDADRRAAILPLFFESFVRAALSEGGDLVISGTPIDGVACWFGPEQHGPSPDAMRASGFSGVLDHAGGEASGRLLALIGALEGEHARAISEEHLRLQFFGVEPSRQGTGIGSALIEHGHERADERGLPCYLDTFTETNVRYYRSRGYDVISTFTVGNVPAYAMLRPARA